VKNEFKHSGEAAAVINVFAKLFRVDITEGANQVHNNLPYLVAVHVAYLTRSRMKMCLATWALWTFLRSVLHSSNCQIIIFNSQYQNLINVQITIFDFLLFSFFILFFYKIRYN